MADVVLNAWPQVPIRWFDLVDIAIVAFLIYEFLKLIRRTRAAQMVAGVVLVFGLYYASERAPLSTVNWLIRDMFGYMVFAAIVLFQADIRRALSNLGRAPFFRYLARPTTTDETIEEVVVVATMLASRRIGAIIAIERQIGLRNYIESGIPLDSSVTYDLLLSIFQTESPLHDGAVIIQDNRVAAAACFLPLTVNPRLSRELGSRHRAAIGITEESDAVAVIVSEETGHVSLALDGQIERSLQPDQLRFRLEALMLRTQLGTRQRVGGRERGGVMVLQLFRDLSLKGFSLALAVLLWLTVAGEPVVERGLEVPLEFENIPSQLEIAGRPPETIHVRVRGSSGVLNRLETGEVVVVLDLSDERAGHRLFDLFAAGRVDAPNGVEVMSVLPSTVALTLETVGSPRTVRIVPAIEGEPAEGLAVGRIVVTPTAVEVMGPETPLGALP